MTLDEAIAHAKEVVGEKREEVKYWNKVKGIGVFTDANTKHLLKTCEECANEHEQLAAWLEELAERREADKWNVIRTEADLPKKDGEYMVIVSSCYGYTFEIGDIDIYKFEAGKFQTDTPVEITHWRPLPKLPESEDEKNETDN